MSNIITQPIINQSSQDIFEIEKQSFEKLKKVASTFLIATNRSYLKVARTGTIRNLISDKKTISTPIQYFYAYMREYDDLAKTIKKHQFLFQQELNTFLERKMTITIVDSSTGEVYFLNEIGAKKLYNRAGKNFGRLNASLSKKFINQLKAGRKKGLDYGLQQTMKSGISRWQQAFQEIIKNMNKNKDNWIYNHKNNNSRNYLGKGYSRGHIAEAYMRAVINDATDLPDINAKIQHLFYYHVHRDAKPGALEGDIVKIENGQIVLNESGLQQHFAVKEDSFSTAKVGQFLAIAQYVSKSDFLTKQELKESLEEIISGGFNIEEVFENATKIATKKIEEAIKNKN